ncbi:MAG: nicotinate-nucleotide adenylyltransferase [Candidatus Eisenbacteria bacterium]
MRIGLFGGTFDPIHVGHLITAEQAREQADLSKVLFVPSGAPPHKERCGISNARARLEMTKLAVAGNERFEVSEFEVRRDCTSFTVETVRHFKRTLGGGPELFLIVGADSILEISTWKEPEALVSECTLVVVSRPGFDLGELDARLRHRVIAVGGIQVDVSSTQIRERVSTGRSIRYMVPAAVAAYIAEHGLYSCSGSC